MANHGAAALLIASLLVAVALSGAVDARFTVRPDAAGAALTGANVRRLVGAHTRFTLRRDANGGFVVDAAVPALTCNKVRGVQADETCFTVAQGEGLTQAQFLSFNPNINCAKIFVGQWVCLDATPA